LASSILAIAAVSLVLGDHRDGLADDPTINGLDQTAALGDVEEGAGGKRLAALLTWEPQQELVLPDLIRHEIEDRLIVEQ
jgi:hypothetical protein